MGAGSAASAFMAQQSGKVNIVAGPTVSEATSGMAVDEENMATPKKRAGAREIGLGSAPDITMGAGTRRSARKRPLEGSASVELAQEGTKSKRIR